MECVVATGKKKEGLPRQHGQPESHHGPKRNEVKQNNKKERENKGRDVQVKSWQVSAITAAR